MSAQAEPAILIGDPASTARAISDFADNASPRTGGATSAGGLSALTRRSGGYLAARYGLSILVGIGNMFVLTWWIGSHAYGIFVTVVGLTTFLSSLTRFGIDTYLIRSEAAPDQRQYNIAFTLVLAISVLLLSVGIAVVPALEWWYSSKELVAPFIALLVMIPVTGLCGVPMARLERALNFRAVAGIELGGQLSSLLVAVVLAWRGMGVWAPVWGFVVWQSMTLLAACIAAGFSPRLEFDRICARQMLSFGFGFSASSRTWQLRALVNPLIVGHFAGAENVAFVAFAVRITEGLSFVRTAAGRLAIPALAPLQSDRVRFREALEKAVKLQVIALGPLLCLFALLGPWAVPRLMGSHWVPSLVVYPFVAAGVLVNSVFNLQASALFVAGRQWAVMRSYTTHVILLAGATCVLVPRYGIGGYGWAELIACAGYIFLHFSLTKFVRISYGKLLPWMAIFLVPLLLQAFEASRRHTSWILGMGLLTASVLALSSRQTAARKSSVAQFSKSIRHTLSFLAKTRTRGYDYVHGVATYQLRSTLYRLKSQCSSPSTTGRRSGTAAVSNVLPANTGGLREESRSPAFHFSAEDIADIVAAVPMSLRKKTVATADDIMRHRFVFRELALQFDSHVDWQARPGGNLSWNWDLNRHAYFVTLGTAFFYTGKREYVRELLNLWDDWITSNPPETWRYPFEVAARLQNWIWAFQLLACDDSSSQHLDRFRRAMQTHADHLAYHLEYHWPNNHLLLEAKALYEFALVFPEQDPRQQLFSRALEALTAETMAQVLDDGVHSELCSMYHRVVAGELYELSALSQRAGRPLPQEVQEKIDSMTAFSRALLRDDGSMPLLGDSSAEDSYIRFDPVAVNYSHLNHWVAGQNNVLEFKPPSYIRQPQLQIFHDAGYAFLRSRCAGAETHVSFDFGSFSRCPSATHGHCDALSFELYGKGRPLVVDPGIYLPWEDGKRWARHFRSTSAHNTLMIDGREQSELSDYCDVGRTAKARLLAHQSGRDSVTVSADCVPCWSDGKVVHRREIRLRNDDSFRVRDLVVGAGRHTLQWTFQFAPELEVFTPRSGLAVGKLYDGTRVFQLKCEATEVPNLALARGQYEPLAGWVARCTSVVLPAYAALFSVCAELPFEIEFSFEIF